MLATLEAHPGLTAAEAALRLKNLGPNEMPHPPRRRLLAIALDVVSEPMFALLLFASALYVVLGELGDALVLSLFASLSVIIALIQQGRSERVLESLRNLASPRALVLRDGAQQRIPARELVVGDVLLMVEGDRIPADCELLSAHDMLIDESLVTGESMPVAKFAVGDAAVTESGQVRALSGTLLVRGNGVGCVTATGASSEIGRIGAVLGSHVIERPRLQSDGQRLVLAAGILGFVVSIAAVLFYGWLRGDWLQALLVGIALGMSMLPEEFPLVVTVFTVMGAWRLSRSRVLTRRPAAIEALGTATVLCADKTGTLTQNRMAVAALRSNAASWQVEQTEQGIAAADSLLALLKTANAAARAEGGDPMERAIATLAARILPDGSVGTPVREYPLRDEQRFIARAWRLADGRLWLAAKGAPEAIADLCGRGEAADALLRDTEQMADRALRVLGVAEAVLEANASVPESPYAIRWRSLGLVGLADPLRESVPAAVRECHEAGVRVVMITGDNVRTAHAIARQAGINDSEPLTGVELDALDAEALRERVRRTTVFARISPLQKLRIIEALKANGEVVAMTGDGVNDAPSLQAAHIGIAMGGRGTDVAREAASLVLLDDDFASVVRALGLGRRIYDNLRKAMAYILAIHLPIAGLALMPLVLDWPLLLTPMLIAMMELVIDPTCSIVFEAEQGEADLMRRPPRRQGGAVLPPALIGWSLLQGGLGLMVAAGSVIWATRSGCDANQVRLVGWLALMGVNLALVTTNRRHDGRASLQLARSQAVVWWGLGLTIGLLVLTTTVAPVRTFLAMSAPSPSMWIVPLVMAALLALLLQMLKPIWARALRS
jgi:Ca2+-transporting ATPase